MSRGRSESFWETVKTIVYAALIAISIRTLAFEPFSIPSGSMIPTLLIGDYLFVSKYSYGYSRYSMPFGIGPAGPRIFERIPERGDVAVFKNPYDPSIDFIKRVTGLPGDRIQMIGGILHINGQPVQRRRVEDVLASEREANILRAPQYVETLPEGRQHRIIEAAGDIGDNDNTPEYVVPPGRYFMMGDNRDRSKDSRYLDEVGYVPAENLVGRAEIIFFSVDGSAGLLEVWKWPFAIRYGRLFHTIE
jgi:signal peptidase I